MNRPHTSPYGASKAALEMATEVWAKEVKGTGLTINIVNPGAGANTPGMAEEMRAISREGRAPRLVEPEEMSPSPPLRRLARGRPSQWLARRCQSLEPLIAARGGRPSRSLVMGYPSGRVTLTPI